jgi:hypothetical protein
MAKLVCPNCGTPTAFTPIFLARDEAFGYTDGTALAARHDGVVKAEMQRRIKDTSYAILECQNCFCCFVARRTSTPDWAAVYPIMRKSVSKDIPQPMQSEFEEASLC